jgi:hypothetical protein
MVAALAHGLHFLEDSAFLAGKAESRLGMRNAQESGCFGRHRMGGAALLRMEKTALLFA